MYSSTCVRLSCDVKVVVEQIRKHGVKLFQGLVEIVGNIHLICCVATVVICKTETCSCRLVNVEHVVRLCPVDGPWRSFQIRINEIGTMFNEKTKEAGPSWTSL